MGIINSTVKLSCCNSGRSTPESQGTDNAAPDVPAGSTQHSNQFPHTSGTNTTSAVWPQQYNEVQGHDFPTRGQIPPCSLPPSSDLPITNVSAWRYGSTGHTHERFVQTPQVKENDFPTGVRYPSPSSLNDLSLLKAPARYGSTSHNHERFVQTPQDNETQRHDFPSSFRYPPSLSPLIGLPLINYSTPTHDGSTSQRVVPTPQYGNSFGIQAPDMTGAHHPSTASGAEEIHIVTNIHDGSTSNIYESSFDRTSISRPSDQMSNSDLNGGTTSAVNLLSGQNQDQVQNTQESTPDPPQEFKQGIKQFVKLVKGKGKMLFKLPDSSRWSNPFTNAQGHLEQLSHRMSSHRSMGP